jgi:hypothetical protein
MIILKSTLYLLGLVSILGVLYFHIYVWNGLTIKPTRRPGIFGYHNLNYLNISDVGNELSNVNSGGMMMILVL